MPQLFLLVIPVKTGIQCFQYVLDIRFRGYDELTKFINRLYLIPTLQKHSSKTHSNLFLKGFRERPSASKVTLSCPLHYGLE